MSNNTYAAKIEDSIVAQVIVGTAEWAIENIGGFWVDTPNKVWLGGTWNEIDGFQPPIVEAPVVEPEI